MSVPTKFEWLPSVSAPTGYPMQVVRGEFVLADGQAVEIPAGAIVNNGWGNVGSLEIRGAPGPKAWPAKLNVTWFSYSENRFYSLSTDLPVDATQAVLTTGYRHPRKGGDGAFDIVLLGLAPGGTVSLWLGGSGIVRRLGQYTGKPAADTWKDILNDDRTPRETYVRDVLSRRISADALLALSRDGAPTEWWVAADQRVPMQFSVVGVPTLRFGWYHAVNGEHEYLDAEQIGAGAATLRAAPIKLEVGWSAPNGERRRAVIELDERETRVALDQLRKDAGTQTFQVVVDLALTSATGSTPVVSLRSAKLRFDLKQVTAKITAG